MSTATGRPRPFLIGVFRTACNYCVRSKRGCSGGNPCEQCQKRGKSCVYAQRRMSGPRGQPSGRSHRVRSRAKARRESRAAAAAAQDAQSAYLESSIFVKQGKEDGGGMISPRQYGNITAGSAEGHYGHQIPLPIPQGHYHPMESMSSGWRSSSIETTNESLSSIYSRDDGDYLSSDGDGIHAGGDNGNDDKTDLVLQGPSRGITNIVAMTDLPATGTRFSNGGGDDRYGGSVGVACHDGTLNGFGISTAGEASSEQQKDRCVRPAPLAKVHSSFSSILDNTLGNDYSDENNYVELRWGEKKPSISVRDSVDPRQSALAKSSSPTRDISTPTALNGNCTQVSDSMSPISEVPRQLKREVTPVGELLGAVPATVDLSPSGAQTLQSPVAIDDPLCADQFSNWTEQEALRLERQQSTYPHRDGNEMIFFGHVTAGKQQDLSHHLQKQQQKKKQRQGGKMEQQQQQEQQQPHKQQQHAPQEVFLWNDEQALDKAAFAAAAAAANADVNLIHGTPLVGVNRGQPLIDPPSHKRSFTEVIPPAPVSSYSGGGDFPPATLGLRCNDSRFSDALPDPRVIVPRREIRLAAHAISPSISGGKDDEGGVGSVGSVIEPLNATASPPFSIAPAILMDLDRSMKVAAGSELHNEFVDLDCATMATMRTPLTREASLIRAMEAVGSEVVRGENGSYDTSAFASVW